MELFPDGGSGARDAALMSEALAMARLAASRGEVPVGALVVRDGVVLGRGTNRSIESSDPTAHAEIVAIREAAARTGNYRLPGAELIVSLEPCLMCFGAALHARIERVAFGAYDPRLGAAERIGALTAIPGALNHRLVIEGGIRAGDCATVLRDFFEERRREAAGTGPVGHRERLAERYRSGHNGGASKAS